MSDLNDWELRVGAETTPFGTMSTDYPFSGQVQMSEIQRETQDGMHPDVDSGIMGRDRLRGFSLEFNATILQEYPVTTKPWMSAMDLYDTFAGRWRADAVRLVPGAYAEVHNTERERFAVGRPRSIAPKYTRARKGYVDFQFDFDSVAPCFFDTSVRSVVRTTPEASIDTAIGGSVNTYPVITTTGAAGQVISFGEPGPGIEWVFFFEFDGPAANTEVVIDTRPWRRSVTIDGEPANGHLLGSRLADAVLRPGTHPINILFNEAESTDPEITVEWYPAYAGL